MNQTGIQDSQKEASTSFMTRTFLKNKEVASKGKDIASLNQINKSFKNKEAASKGKDIASFNQSLNNYSIKSLVALNQINESFQNLNENLSFFEKSSQVKKDYSRKKDPNLKMNKGINEISSLMKLNNKLLKDQQKGKGILGFLGNVAKIVAIGGLVGWLLFGEDKYAKQVRDMFGKVGSFIWDGIHGWWDEGGKESVKKMGNKIWNGIHGWWDEDGKKMVGDFLGKVWETIKKHPWKSAGAGLLGFLLTGNLGSLTAIGSLFGNVAIKLLGTALANPQATIMIASAAAAAYAGIKAKELFDVAEDVKKTREDRETKATERDINRADAQKFIEQDKDRLEQIDKEIQEIDKDLIKTPGGTKATLATLGDFFLEAPMRKLGMKGFEEQIYDPSTSFGEKIKLFERPEYKAEFAPTGKWTQEGKIKALQKYKSQLITEKGKMFGSYGPYSPPTDVNFQSTDINPYPGIRLNDNEVNLKGLKSPVLDSLIKMGQEYFDKTGGQDLIVTSGFRSREKQQELYDRYQRGEMPYIVAPPGSSPHERGESVDINSSQVSQLKSLGLLETNNFTQPLPYKDPVHLNHLSNIKKSKGEEGDDITNNLPSLLIDFKRNNNKIMPLELSESTITNLARALGVSFKNSIPGPSTNQINLDVGMRG